MTDLKRAIAYSTMSQIGYMVLGVSVFAYSAGMFHLMTHAFFKALLFMGAGSVIAAMANEQSLDKMGGFRKAMPFTYVTFTAGALALAGFPLTSGFFSKDEILAYTINRGDWFIALAVVGYLAAFMTAVYAFRLVFRVFHGEPCAEARELENGHLAHAEPFNPATGEAEDTDVGLPGPRAPHRRAREGDEDRDGSAGAAGDRRRRRPDPGRHRRDREVPRADLRRLALRPRPPQRLAPSTSAWRSARASRSPASWSPRASTSGGRAPRRSCRPASRRCTRCWRTSGTSTRPTTTASSARSPRLGRFGRTVIESAFVQGFLVGGTVGIVRAGSSFARSIQTGELRAYAAVLLLGLSGVVLYFLIASS